MKIAVLEFDHHTEVLQGLLSILNGTDTQVEVFTTESLMKDLQTSNYGKNLRWNIAKKTQSLSAFLDSKENVLKECDLLFASTVESNFSIWNRLASSYPLVIRIHNANTYLRPWKSLTFPSSALQLWKFSSYIIRKGILEREWYLRSKLVGKVKGVCFPDEGITSHSKNLNAHVKVFPPIPMAHFTPHHLPYQDLLSISIVGVIESRRKSYMEALKIIQSVKKTGRRVELNLLGKPKGRFGIKIISKFKALEDDLLKLNTWNSRVSQADFDEYIQKSHILLSPIKPVTHYFLWREEYGKTKISGSVYDAVKFGIPNLIPSHYPAPPNTEDLLIQYSDISEAAEHIANWNVSIRTQSAEKALQKWNLEKIQAKTNSAFEQMIND